MLEARSRVLIVDDEVFFLEAIDEILSKADFETVQAEDGESALVAVSDPTWCEHSTNGVAQPLGRSRQRVLRRRRPLGSEIDLHGHETL